MVKKVMGIATKNARGMVLMNRSLLSWCQFRRPLFLAKPGHFRMTLDRKKSLPIKPDPRSHLDGVQQIFLLPARFSLVGVPNAIGVACSDLLGTDSC